MTVADAPELADWQQFTRDPQDTYATDRCETRSDGPEIGLCLRRRGHPRDYHEGRTTDGLLISWSVPPFAVKRQGL